MHIHEQENFSGVKIDDGVSEAEMRIQLEIDDFARKIEKWAHLAPGEFTVSDVDRDLGFSDPNPKQCVRFFPPRIDPRNVQQDIQKLHHLRVCAEHVQEAIDSYREPNPSLPPTLF